MRRLTRIISALATFLSVLAFAGIATQALSPPQQPAGKELIPLASWQKEFKIIHGSDEGKLVPLTSQPDSADGKRWRLVFGDYASLLLRSDPSGGVMMERLDLPGRHSYVVYEPALPVLPGDIHSPSPIRRQTAYKMYSIETGKLKRSGRVTHAIKQITKSFFETPAGRIEGYYVEIDHRMDMEYYSKLHITLGLGCRLDEGPVFGTGEYTLTRLGIFTETKAAAAGLAVR
jgi:hypothetical protein